jgi:hypothetical protein
MTFRVFMDNMTYPPDYGVDVKVIRMLKEGGGRGKEERGERKEGRRGKERDGQEKLFFCRSPFRVFIDNMPYLLTTALKLRLFVEGDGERRKGGRGRDEEGRG